MKTLADLKAAFRAGTLPKPAYIDEMNVRHQILHDYAEFIQSTDIASIEIRDGEVSMVMRDSGLRMICQRGDKRIAPLEILNFGALEKAEADMTKALIRPSDTVFDVGANIGWYSLTLERLLPKLTIYAFEPIPGTFETLRRHVQLNRSRRVKAYNFGFSSESGRKTFYFPEGNSVNASAADLAGGGRKVVCELRRLDDFAKRIHVDFIKCDVEGAELFVFKGAMSTLKRDRPIIFTEMLRKWSAPFGYHPNEIIELLRGLGYRCYTVAGRRLKPFERMDATTTQTNFFFLDPTRHAVRLKSLPSR